MTGREKKGIVKTKTARCKREKKKNTELTGCRLVERVNEGGNIPSRDYYHHDNPSPVSFAVQLDDELLLL